MNNIEASDILGSMSWKAKRDGRDNDAQALARGAVALRMKEARDNPKPLTLGELRERDGKPVWTVTNGVDGSGRWELITFTTLCACPFRQVITMTNLIDGQEDYDLDSYGKTWRAYDCEPKGR
jgi:hypothetical protein